MDDEPTEKDQVINQSDRGPNGLDPLRFESQERLSFDQQEAQLLQRLYHARLLILVPIESSYATSC